MNNRPLANMSSCAATGLFVKDEAPQSIGMDRRSVRYQSLVRCVSEWRRCFHSVDTPSLKSMDYVMTKHKIAFDLAHRAVR